MSPEDARPQRSRYVLIHEATGGCFGNGKPWRPVVYDRTDYDIAKGLTWGVLVPG